VKYCSRLAVLEKTVLGMRVVARLVCEVARAVVRKKAVGVRKCIVKLGLVYAGQLEFEGGKREEVEIK
jgi:hypothetical protein